MKVAIAILIFSVVLFNLHSLNSMNGRLIDKDDSLGFTVEPSFGFLYGENREIVYLNGVSSEYLSELIWDLTDILYTGASASLNVRNRFYVNAGMWTAVFGGNGYMNDFDWLNLTGESYPTYDLYGRSGWTNWSLSDVDVINSLIMDINVSYDLISRRQLAINTIVGYKYLYWDWTDSVLDNIYPPGWEDLVVGSDAIDYQVELHIPYIGVGSEWRPAIGFLLLSRIIYSPLVVGGDHDHHIQRTDYGPGGIHFYDNILMGQYISGTIKAGYAFTHWFALMAELSGEYLFETRGSTFVYDNYGNYQGSIINGAGIQYQSLSASINLTFSF